MTPDEVFDLLIPDDSEICWDARWDREWEAPRPDRDDDWEEEEEAA